MAIIANTFKSYEAKGIREELADVIYNISPEDTPFLTRAGRGKASNTYFEWQVDELAAADEANAQLEGDDITSFDAVTPTVRLGNYCQISRKTAIVSDTEEVLDKAGRDGEMAYQLSKKGAELKLDMEKILLGNTGAVAGAAATPRKTGTMGAFVKTNTNKEATGTDPVYTDKPTDPRNDGVQRPFTEVILKDVMSQCFTEGAKPSILMLGPWNKAVASGFSGIATKNINQNGAKPATIIGTADVYVSDFGTLEIIPSRLQRGRDAWFLDFSHIKVRYLRKFKTVPLAKTGDAEKRMIIVEYGLMVNNEKSQGLAADLTTA